PGRHSVYHRRTLVTSDVSARRAWRVRLQEPPRPRELEVLRLVAAGHSNREIADELVLSVRTVERHINNLYAKIGARGKADATAYAFRTARPERRTEWFPP